MGAFSLPVWSTKSIFCSAQRSTAMSDNKGSSPSPRASPANANSNSFQPRRLRLAWSICATPCASHEGCCLEIVPDDRLDIRIQPILCMAIPGTVPHALEKVQLGSGHQPGHLLAI